MATKEVKEDSAEEPKEKGGLVKMLVLVLVGMAVGAGAVSIPLVVLADKSDGQPKPVEPAYLKFGEAVTSLGGEENANRYIGINLTLQVNEDEAVEIQEKVDKRKAVLTTWLLAHMSDKSLEDVRGAAGQNRLRREIQDSFNNILFDDRIDRIQDVLFEEFKIQ